MCLKDLKVMIFKRWSLTINIFVCVQNFKVLEIYGMYVIRLKEDSASTATESDEAEASEKPQAAPQKLSVVDQLQTKFPSIPRADITRGKQ